MHDRMLVGRRGVNAAAVAAAALALSGAAWLREEAAPSLLYLPQRLLA